MDRAGVKVEDCPVLGAPDHEDLRAIVAKGGRLDRQLGQVDGLQLRVVGAIGAKEAEGFVGAGRQGELPIRMPLDGLRQRHVPFLRVQVRQPTH